MILRAIIILSFLFFIFTHVFYAYLVIVVFDNTIPLLLTPSNMYKTTTLNWIGCIFLYIIALLVVPLYPIVAFFHWLFTFGKNKEGKK